MAECAIPECSKPAWQRGWCMAHYKRWRSHGDPLGGGPPREWQVGTCAVEGCESERESRGYCGKHYARWRKHGDPTRVDTTALEVPGYTAVHMRLRAKRGSASELPCADCGEPAHFWSFEHKTAEVQYVSPGGQPYSTALDDYVPRCGACHVRYDEVQARAWEKRRGQ